MAPPSIERTKIFHIPPNPAHKAAKPKTIRISLIRKIITFEELQSWLKDFAGPDNKIIQLSMAPKDSKFCQATATLSTLPAQLKDIEKRVQIIIGLRGFTIEIDIHFQGMTVLYDPLQHGAEPAIAE